MNAPAALTVAGLDAGYGRGGQVLQDVSLEVAPGEVVVLLGANGAGKTTLMRCITATLAHTGSVRIGTRELSGLSPDKVVTAGIACVPQGRGTFNELSVVDNLRVGALLLPKSRRSDAVERWLTRLPRLAERRGVPAGMLSGGEQQMLAIARACLTEPRILLCDEPSLGLSPAMTAEVFTIFTELHRELGLSMLVVEQNAHIALGVAERAYVLEGGRIVWTGTPARLVEDEALVSAYLGDLEETA